MDAVAQYVDQSRPRPVRAGQSRFDLTRRVQRARCRRPTPPRRRQAQVLGCKRHTRCHVAQRAWIQLGGKPVYPYQPAGIWDSLAITKERDFTYPQSTGDDLYRRSLYTFWRRTVAPANLFDASTRNVCKVRLGATSTPLHALTLLNDPTYVEAARGLAEQAMCEAKLTPDARLDFAFRKVLARHPDQAEAKLLRASFDKQLAKFRTDLAAAESFLSTGTSPRNAKLDVSEHAAYAAVCLGILNLDETLTKP